MRRALAGLALVCLLSACSRGPGIAETQSTGGEGYAAVDAAAPMIAMEEAADAPMREMAPPPASPPPPPGDADASGGLPGPQTQPTAGPAPVLFLAYSYQMGLELPAPRFDAVMQGHVKACQDAGPRLCQLIGSSRSGDPDHYMQGYVNLRGEPAWLRTFMTGVARGAEEAGGRIKSQSTNTEDLTRAIVDTEANLRAKTTLRDRLQRLLASRPGRLSDLLEVERELARVQAEIDSTQSNLAVMRTRVAMSELSLNYETEPQALRGNTFEPLGNAFASFVGLVVQGVAAIVTVVAVALPWVLVIWLVVWLVLIVRKKRGGRFFNRTPKAPPAPATGEN